ncbi:MAG: hypothetical protein F6K64_15345 [Moorea sp. SIO3A2]|nr:hypothetical protein [Moorena sp. SIO3A2]
MYKSDQSYYSLFKEAKISWKKTQKKNPAKNEDLVEAKKAMQRGLGGFPHERLHQEEEIENKLENWHSDIKALKLAVFMIDECHLLWGDLLGYAWGRTRVSARKNCP